MDGWGNPKASSSVSSTKPTIGGYPYYTEAWSRLGGCSPNRRGNKGPYPGSMGKTCTVFVCPGPCCSRGAPDGLAQQQPERAQWRNFSTVTGRTTRVVDQVKTLIQICQTWPGLTPFKAHGKCILYSTHVNSALTPRTRT